MAIYFFYGDNEPIPFEYLSPTRQIGGLPFPYATNLSPSGYVEYAIEDLAADTPRGHINAFANAKRAIHLLIDIVLNQYGLFNHFRRANFPTKLQLLDEIGLIPIGIMTNLNVERNLLEHEYSTPPRKRVQEAVDVAKLLIMATEKLLEATPQEVLVGWRKPKRHSLLRLEPQKGQIELFRIWAPGHYSRRDSVSYICTPIRAFAAHSYNSGIKVAKKPWLTIPLDGSHKDDWRLILSELVAVQRRSALPRAFGAQSAVSVSVVVTIPFSMPENLTWNDVLDNAMKDRTARGKAQNSRVEHAPERAGAGPSPQIADGSASGKDRRRGPRSEAESA